MMQICKITFLFLVFKQWKIVTINKRIMKNKLYLLYDFLLYSQYKIFLWLIIALLCLIWYKKSFIYQKRFSCRKSSPSLSYQFSFHTTLISLCHIVVKACNNNMPSSSIPFCVCFNFSRTAKKSKSNYVHLVLIT